jgi:hypothetical protein
MALTYRQADSPTMVSMMCGGFSDIVTYFGNNQDFVILIIDEYPDFQYYLQTENIILHRKNCCRSGFEGVTG